MRLERLTESGRRVFVLAQEEARGLRHNRVGTGHILLGLLRVGASRNVLTVMGVNQHRAREYVSNIVPKVFAEYEGELPYTKDAEQVGEKALREALALGHNYIDPEHILLGLIRINGSMASMILAEFNVTPDDVRAKIDMHGRALVPDHHPEVVKALKDLSRACATLSRHLIR